MLAGETARHRMAGADLMASERAVRLPAAGSAQLSSCLASRPLMWWQDGQNGQAQLAAVAIWTGNSLAFGQSDQGGANRAEH